MNKIHWFSFLVGTGALLLSIILISTVVPFMGEQTQPSMYVSAVIGSYGIGSPVAYYCFRQGLRLAGTLKQLEIAHGELALAHRLLSHKASRDQMTGFLNREHFFEAVSRARLAGETSALLIVDADHFKQVNDQWGHLKGDEAIALITGAISSSIRRNDIVGRIGGEEFGIFLPDASDQDALFVAERIRRSVECVVFRPGGMQPWPLTVSVGGALASSEPPISQLMRAADIKLYEAKRSGRNRTVMAQALQCAA